MHRRIQQHNHCQGQGRPILGLCLRGVTGAVHIIVAVVAAVVAVAAVLAMVASVRPLPLGPVANGWVEASLEDRLAERGLIAHLGALDVSFRAGLVPVVTAKNIELRRRDGSAPLVSLADAEIVLHRGEAALGLIAPKALRLSGVKITAVSSGDAVALDLDQAQVIPAVSSPGELIARLQSLFERPALARIEEIGLTGIELHAEDRVNGWSWRSRSGDLRISRARDALRVDLSLSGLDGADPQGNATPGSLAVRLVSDLTRSTGTLQIAGRGLNPAQFLPSQGARITAGAMAIDAPVSLDLSGDILPDGDLGPLRGRVAIGSGQIPLPGGTNAGIEAISANLYVAHGQDHVRLSNLHVRSDRVSLDGDAQLVLAKTPLGVLRSAAAQLSLRDVWVAPGLGVEHPLDAEFLEAAIEFHRPTGKITLGPSYLVTGGQSVEVSGYLIPPPQGDLPVRQISLRPNRITDGPQSRKMLPDGWQASLDLAADRLSAETALAFWPSIVEPKVREWVLENLFTGKLSQARLAMRLEPIGRPSTGVTFRFSDVAAWATPQLPAFEGGAGFFSLQDRRLAVQIDHAKLPLSNSSHIALRDGVLVKADVRQKDSPLAISGHGDAMASQVLTLLQQPLFQPKGGSRQEMPLQPQEVAGQVSLDLALTIPMGPDRRARRVTFEGLGVLQDVATEGLLPGRQLESSALSIDLSQDRILLSGPVTLDGLPATAHWQKPLGPGAEGSSVQVSAPLTQALAASFGVPIRPHEMQGAGLVDAQVVLQPGQAPDLKLTADLTGATLRVPGLGWYKPPERGGTVTVAGRLGAAPEFKTLRLDAPGLLADGALRIGAAGGLAALDFTRLRIGRWIDAPLRIRPSGGQRIAVTMNGGLVDIRHLPKSNGGENPVSTARLSGARVRVDESLVLTGVSGTLDLQRQGSGDLTGRINDRAPVSLRLSAADTGTRIRVRSNNAGAAARAAGVFAQGAGGNLTLTLTPTGRPEQFYGKLKVEDLTITEAPVATSLLSAISLVGLAEQIGAGGLHFGRVDAAFLLTPDAVVVSESSATGPSLGLSMDGTLDLKAKTMDMQGVLSPFYFVNRMGSGLTRRGEGLLGFTFRLQGPFKDPDVRSNPLSFLTPGMFREIFRRAPPDIRQGPTAQ